MFDSQLANVKLDLLQDYFTPEEINFIDKVLHNSKEIEDNIILSSKNKESILLLKDKITSTELEAEATHLLFIINENIKKLYFIKNSENKFVQLIIELLIKIQTEPNFNIKYSEQILKIKSIINQLNVMEDDSKEKLANFKEKLSSFLTKNLFEPPILYSDTAVEPNESSNIFEELDTLIISEKFEKVFLPYSKSEIDDYLREYPSVYSTPQDVISKEYVLPLRYFLKHPKISRFRESYSLMRDKEAKSILESLNFARSLMFKYDVNPIIIAACKNYEQLKKYLKCIEEKNMNDFDCFEIKFEVAPMNTRKRFF